MGRPAELSQRLGFDLANPFTRYVELPAHLLESMLLAYTDSEAHAQDALLPRGQAREQVGDHIAKVPVHGEVDGLNGAFILDEVAALAVILVPDRAARERAAPLKS